MVTAGRAGVDESMLTGDRCRSREVRVTNDRRHDQPRRSADRARHAKSGRRTALAQIVRLVEYAQASKPPVSNWPTASTPVFVPAVLLIALATAIGWCIYGTMKGHESAILWANLARAVCRHVDRRLPHVRSAWPFQRL